MRTIEEIKTDLSENNGMLLIQSVLTKEEKIKCLLKQIDLENELIVAQDAEIARLRQQLEWQPIETAPINTWILVLDSQPSRLSGPVSAYQYLRMDGKYVWIPIPPLPQPQEGSPMDNTLTDEVYP